MEAQGDQQLEIGLVRSWSIGHIQPLIDAIYQGRLAEARQLHTQAGRELEAADLPADVREALGYQLLFYHFNIRWQANEAAWNQEEYFEARKLFEQPAMTVLGDIERVHKLIVIRYHADTDRLDPLTEEALMGLIDSLHGYPDDTVWFYAAGWAFRHRCLSILERAYGEMLVNPSQVLGQARWQRINLMYLLVAGRATRRDVLETIKLLTVLPQLREFTKLIWPRCLEAGLVDAELEALLAERTAKIETETPAPVRNEPRTRRVRRDC